MNTASITLKFDPKTGKVLNEHEIKMPKIDTNLIPPLERRLLGKTFYEAMERFYSDPENCRRFEEWKKVRDGTAGNKK